MVPDQANSILETVAASIQGTGGQRDIPVQAGDTLKDLELSRLRLLAVLIELEDKFAIEFTPDAINGFRSVGDITFYIHTRELAPYDDVADERPAATCRSIERHQSGLARFQPLPPPRIHAELAAMKRLHWRPPEGKPGAEYPFKVGELQ